MNTWQQHTCAGPWYGGKPLTPTEIIWIGHVRLGYVHVDIDKLAFIDPYASVRADQRPDDHPDDRVPAADTAIREALRTYLQMMFSAFEHQWAATGQGPTFEWVAGGVAPDDADLNLAVTAIRAFALVSLWAQPISTTEVDNAREQIARRTKGARRG